MKGRKLHLRSGIAKRLIVPLAEELSDGRLGHGGHDEIAHVLGKRLANSAASVHCGCEPDLGLTRMQPTGTSPHDSDPDETAETVGGGHPVLGAALVDEVHDLPLELQDLGVLELGRTEDTVTKLATGGNGNYQTC